MEKQLFRNESTIKRIKLLEDHCDCREELQYAKPYTVDELTEKRKQLAELAVELHGLNAELDAIKAEFKIKTQPLKDALNTAITDLKFEMRNVVETCYKKIDQKKGIVGYYNQDGDLIKQREISPEEKQLNLKLVSNE